MGRRKRTGIDRVDMGDQADTKEEMGKGTTITQQEDV